MDSMDNKQFTCRTSAASSEHSNIGKRTKWMKGKTDRKGQLAMKTARNTDFFRQFNGAFFQGDRQFIEANITEDIVWTMVGSEPIIGKQAFLDVAFGVGDGYSNMDYTAELSLTNGKEAALKGKMIRKGPGNASKTYAYCDFYVLDDEADSKVKELTTFVIELKD